MSTSKELAIEIARLRRPEGRAEEHRKQQQRGQPPPHPAHLHPSSGSSSSSPYGMKARCSPKSTSRASWLQRGGRTFRRSSSWSCSIRATTSSGGGVSPIPSGAARLRRSHWSTAASSTRSMCRPVFGDCPPHHLVSLSCHVRGRD